MSTNNRIRRKNWCNKCLAPVYEEHWRDYCGATSIHGVRYLGEPHRPLSERIWWVVVFVGSFLLNSYLINEVWKKWNESPVIVSFSEVTTPVWQVPFPAITICPLTKYDATEYPDVREQLFHSDEKDMQFSKMAGDVSLLCDVDTVVSGDRFTDDNITDFYRSLVEEMESQLLMISFRGQVLEVSEYVSEVVTEEGPCYTFNMLDHKELFTQYSGLKTPKYNITSGGWSLDKGYPKNAPLETYPMRVGNSGLKESVKIILKVNVTQFDYACQGLSPGFKVTLHTPTQFPDVGGKYFKVPAGSEVIVGVLPDIMTTSDTLKSYTPQMRQCYFPYERQLAYFKVYTQQNCLMECHINNTIDNCHCTAFYMPRSDPSIPICGPGSRQCILDAEMEMNGNLNEAKVLVSLKNFTLGDCQCLPSCNSIRYKTDVSLSAFNIEKFLEFYKADLTAFEGLEFSSLSVYFPEKQFTTSRRNELYGTVDFLANCGGLLSLFSGLSLLSVIEILYFASLRLWNQLQANKRAKKTAAEEI